MFCKHKSGTLFVFLVSVYFQLCCSVSSAQRGESAASSGRDEMKQDGEQWKQLLQVIRSPGVRGLREARPERAASVRQPLPQSTAPQPAETHSDSANSSLTWTAGNVSRGPRSTGPNTEEGHAAGFTDLRGVPGEILGLLSDSSPHFSEWQAMRPLVECDENVMTFTTSGQEFTHLFVDREGDPPISVLHLPPYCGYSLTTSQQDLEMMVPYDACYITEENGSYVLPLLWWGSPLKLSCPVQTSTPAPSLFCFPHGMVVQIQARQNFIQRLTATVSGDWVPFVSERCAYHVDSHTFAISFSAACIKRERDLLLLQMKLDDQEYTLSCPVSGQLPSLYSLQLPGVPQVPDIPVPSSLTPTSPPPPPHLPSQEQIKQHYHFPGFQYSLLPQVSPPSSEPSRPPQPSPGSPPGLQQQLLNPTGPGKSPVSLVYPSDYHQAPFDSFQYPLLYYPSLTPAPTTAAPETISATSVPSSTQPPKPPDSQYDPQYYLQIPYYHTPVTQTPAPFPPPKQPVAPQFQTGPFSPAGYSSHYPYWPVSFYSMTAPPHIPPTDTTNVPSFQPTYIKRPTPQSPAEEQPQKPVDPQTGCPASTHNVCGYYFYPYHPYHHALYPPHYHPPYPPVLQYPDVQIPVTTEMTSTTTVKSTTTSPTTMTKATTTPATTPTTTSTTTGTTSSSTPQIPRLQCLKERMVASLPSAHPESIQVRDKTKTWLYLSNVAPHCGYTLQRTDGSEIILHSPLPACHSRLQTPTTISLPVRFWDVSVAQHRTLDLQCPYQSSTESPATVTSPASTTPLASTTPPSTTKAKTSSPVDTKTKVVCATHQMTVELPAGPISGIVVKDIKGNQMKLQEAPKHCGYSASKGKNGKIHLRLQLNSYCHMTVQGKKYIITVSYMTVSGRKEAQFSCPVVVVPGSGQECSLPSEQRLPCGPSSVSQSQCLSMGCCFNKPPPACYYPMDECTIDRHFVFSVPASLTEPPLAPPLLVAASNSTCKPQRVTPDYALFKIPMDGCGTRRVVVEKTVVYMVEIINKIETISLNYGTITRSSPVRLLVECRFVPGTLLSVSYVVKSPSFGPEVQSSGVFGVQLRLARDAQYSSYYPQYHQPLQMLLGKPLYLEVRLLNSPDPTLVLLVHFCVAYPRSGNAVWVLLYNGCPNPLDPALEQAVGFNPPPPSLQSQTRRFTISTFQFLPDGEFKDPNEELRTWKMLEVGDDADLASDISHVTTNKNSKIMQSVFVYNPGAIRFYRRSWHSIKEREVPLWTEPVVWNIQRSMFSFREETVL